MTELFSVTHAFALAPLYSFTGAGHCDTWLNVLRKRQTPKGSRLFGCKMVPLAVTHDKSPLLRDLGKWVEVSPWT